jgi:DNA-binding NarL/FixJ family response regulator
MDRIPISVCAHDPVSYAGVVSQLRSRPEVQVVEGGGGSARAVVVAADAVDEATLHLLREHQRDRRPIVLVVTTVDDAGLAAAVEAGVAGLVRRTEATADRLTEAVRAVVRGEGAVPPDLLGRLLAQVGRVQRQFLTPRGMSFTGLSSREADILRLVAEGMDTTEIATSLSYSERTVKNVLHDVTSRLQLRNRSHAVAYALRQGMI